MWAHFCSALRAKCPNALEATKVEGHATQKMVDTGKETEANKQGNDRANQIASEGVKLFGEKVVRIGATFMRRQMECEKFMNSIHDHIVDAFKTKTPIMKAKGIRNKDDDQPEIRTIKVREART